MAASAPVNENAHGISGLVLTVADTLVIYNRAKTALRGPDHATSASRGQIAPFAAAKGNIPLGPGSPNYVPSSGSATSVTGTTVAPKPTCSADLKSYVLEKKAVTGYAADTDNGKWVYLSDDDTLTLTRPAIGIPVGITIGYVSTAIGHVYMFSFETMLAISAGGNAKELIFLGELDFSTVIDGNNRIGIKMPYHGKIVEFFGMVKQVNVGSGGTILLNLEIDATDVTGGVLTWSTAEANVLGERLDATAITAANAFSEGSLLDIEGASAGGTRTSGLIELFMLVEKQPGL